MDFSQVKDLIIPEGRVTKISIDGTTVWQFKTATSFVNLSFLSGEFMAMFPTQDEATSRVIKRNGTSDTGASPNILIAQSSAQLNEGDKFSLLTWKEAYDLVQLLNGVNPDPDFYVEDERVVFMGAAPDTIGIAEETGVKYVAILPSNLYDNRSPWVKWGGYDKSGNKLSEGTVAYVGAPAPAFKSDGSIWTDADGDDKYSIFRDTNGFKTSGSSWSNKTPKAYLKESTASSSLNNINYVYVTDGDSQTNYQNVFPGSAARDIAISGIQPAMSNLSGRTNTYYDNSVGERIAWSKSGTTTTDGEAGVSFPVSRLDPAAKKYRITFRSRTTYTSGTPTPRVDIYMGGSDVNANALHYERPMTTWDYTVEFKNVIGQDLLNI